MSQRRKPRPPLPASIPAVVNDERFAKAVKDPRFRPAPKGKAKVAVDERFSGMLSDPAFSTAWKVDKYGRRQKKNTGNELRRIYVDKNKQREPEPAPEPESESEQEEEGADKDEKETKEVESSENESSGSDSDSDSSSDSDSEAAEESEEPEEPEDIPLGEQTHRLALLNCDWSRLRGLIKSLTVYPSNFGLERLKKEAVDGPPAEIWTDGTQDETKGAGFSLKKLRKYEKSKLRYYYAVVECDSVATAAAIYAQCDGLELEQTGNVIDLRFVPDDEKFTNPPRDVARDVPANYTAPKFESKALQHTNLNLTWDEDDATRVELTTKSFAAGEVVEEEDYRAFLASDSESEDEEEAAAGANTKDSKKEAIRKKYQQLLQDIAPVEQEEENMEITFLPGLSSAAETLLKNREVKAQQAEETVWEKHLREAKEKKKERRKEHLASKKAEEEQKAASKGKLSGIAASRKQKEADEKQKAELELLLLEEGTAQKKKGFNLDNLVDPKSLKGKKDRRKRAREDSNAASEAATFELDLKDDRFSSIFKSKDFEIDPTSALFKKTPAMQALLAEKRKRHKIADDMAEAQAVAKLTRPKADKQPIATELLALAESVKRKGSKK